MKQPVNLTPLQKDYAVYLPAISSFYSTYIAKQREGEFVPNDRIPKGFDRGIEGMNFLNPEQGYFTYKYGLYSAGHAQLDLNKFITPSESSIMRRFTIFAESHSTSSWSSASSIPIKTIRPAAIDE